MKMTYVTSETPGYNKQMKKKQSSQIECNLYIKIYNLI